MPPDNKKLFDFLQNHMVAALATTRPTGQAHVSTVYYAVDKNLNFFFVTKEKTTKYANITNDAKVALVVSDDQTLDTVQAEGIARKALGQEFLFAVDGLIQKVIIQTHQQWDKIPVSLIKSGHFAFFVIEPSWIRWTNYKDWNNAVKFEYTAKT